MLGRCPKFKQVIAAKVKYGFPGFVHPMPGTGNGQIGSGPSNPYYPAFIGHSDSSTRLSNDYRRWLSCERRVPQFGSALGLIHTVQRNYFSDGYFTETPGGAWELENTTTTRHSYNPNFGEILTNEYTDEQLASDLNLILESVDVTSLALNQISFPHLHPANEPYDSGASTPSQTSSYGGVPPNLPHRIFTLPASCAVLPYAYFYRRLDFANTPSSDVGRFSYNIKSRVYCHIWGAYRREYFASQFDANGVRLPFLNNPSEIIDGIAPQSGLIVDPPAEDGFIRIISRCGKADNQ